MIIFRRGPSLRALVLVSLLCARSLWAQSTNPDPQAPDDPNAPVRLTTTVTVEGTAPRDGYRVESATSLGSLGPVRLLDTPYNFQFTYEHTAAATAKTNASYRYAALPPEIDLSLETAGQYAASVITIPGLGIRGSSGSIAIPASVVEWGVTIPTNAGNPESAVAFVRHLIGPAGRAALTASGPAPMTQARVSRQDYRRLPVELRNLTAAD